MTTPREPDRLPCGVETWEEWRELYADFRRAFVEEHVDRIRYDAYLAMLGMSEENRKADLAEAFEARKKWRDGRN